VLHAVKAMVVQSPRRPNSSSACFPSAQAVWTPHLWTSEGTRARPPIMTHAQLMHVCGPVRLHVIQPEARRFVQTEAAWFKYTRTRDTGSNHSHVISCVSALRAFRPRVCTLTDVFVWGPNRRLFNESSYFIPPGAAADQRAHDLVMSQANAVQSCWGKARNLFGPIGGHAVCRLLRLRLRLAWQLSGCYCRQLLELEGMGHTLSRLRLA
jgi:hypothetical protein